MGGIVGIRTLKGPHNLMATPPPPTSGNYRATSPQTPLPRSGFVLVPTAAYRFRPDMVILTFRADRILDACFGRERPFDTNSIPNGGHKWRNMI